MLRCWRPPLGVNWTGLSAQKYTYYMHQLPWRPSADQTGNYIFAKVVNEVVWNAVYIGQGILQDRYDAALDEGCVSSKGATHYHEHLNGDADARRSEEQDLIDGRPECHWPTGCNGHG